MATNLTARPLGGRFRLGRGSKSALASIGSAVVTLFMLVAGGLKYVLLSAILFAPGTILFILARREQGQPLFTPVEWALFAAVVAAAIFGVVGLATGTITI